MGKRNEITKQNSLSSGINIKIVLRLAGTVACAWLVTKLSPTVWSLLGLVAVYGFIRLLVRCALRLAGFLVSAIIFLLAIALIIVFIF